MFPLAKMADSDASTSLQRPLKRTLRTFWRASGHCNVKKITREVYYRTDIGCGVEGCERCPRSSSQVSLDADKPLLILTVDVLMKQMTFCERCLTNCVIPATVSNEVRRRSLTMYARMKKLLQSATSSANDITSGECEGMGAVTGRKYFLFSNENFVETYVEDNGNENMLDRDNVMIEKCATWYKHHHPNIRVILLKNNRMISEVSGGNEMNAVPGDTVSETEKLLNSDAQSSSNVSMSSGGRVVDATDSPFTEMTVGEWAAELKSSTDDVFNYIVASQPEDSTYTGDTLSIGGKDVRHAIYPLHLSDSEMREGIETGKYYSGVLNMYSGSYQHGYVSCGKDEYKITGCENLNRAIHGDNVCIEVIGNVERIGENGTVIVPEKKSEDKPIDLSELPENLVGKDSDDANVQDYTREDTPVQCLKKECRVVGILQRNWREYCGSLMPIDEAVDICGSHSSVQRLFVPVDARIPFIYIDTRKSRELDKKRIVVAIDSWSRFSLKPSGHLIQVLGDVEDLETESAVILKEHDVISRDFPLNAYRELPPDDWVPSADEISRRMDFRKQLVFSVDPPNCKDIDDALGYRELDNGHIEVSVHIADVTHFVKPNSSLDREAAQRCTTVYLVDRRTDMLPSLLTTNLCSLVANQDRLCFSVVWEFDENNVIYNTRFGKGIIRSARAFTYLEAQTLLDKNGSDEISCALRGLDRLAKFLRAKRFERGAVELESPDVKFEYDLTDIGSMEKYILYDTNRMVEELMLLANISVAGKIFERFPAGSLLRRHPPPVEERMKALQRSLSQQKLDFEFGNSRDLNTSLKRIVEDSDPMFGSAVRILTTRCMSQAIYCNSGDYNTEEYRHYGLCTELYTHFTSPIRRYADVIVHRMLAAALDIEPMDTNFFRDLSAQCDVLNRRNRNAKWCGRESVKLFAYLFMKKHGKTTSAATVVGANEKKLCLLSHQFGIEATAEVDVAEYNPETQSVSLRSGRCIKLFDHVTIQLDANQKHFRYNITAELV